MPKRSTRPSPRDLAQFTTRLAASQRRLLVLCDVLAAQIARQAKTLQILRRRIR